LTSNNFSNYKTKAMDIKKIKLRKDDTLEVEYTNEQGDEISLAGMDLVHADLKASLAKLNPFLAEIAEQVDSSGAIPEIKVTGYSRGGSDDHQGAVLVGQRKLEANRILNLVTPFVKFNPDLEPYPYCAQMWRAIKSLETEVVAYLKKEKIGGAKQMEIFEPAAQG
jgi:hypothetical protein